MNGIYLYFVNKHLPSWALLGLLLHSNPNELSKFLICLTNGLANQLANSLANQKFCVTKLYYFLNFAGSSQKTLSKNAVRIWAKKM